jgi:hypothetical protein
VDHLAALRYWEQRADVQVAPETTEPAAEVS